MAHDSAPHDFAGDLERGQVERFDEKHLEDGSPRTVSGDTLNGGCAETRSAMMSSPDPSMAEEPAPSQWRKRISSWIPQRSFSLRKQNEMAIDESRATVRSLEDYPVGYPRTASYLDSDEQFMIYRRFGLLHARSLMYLQDELRELEGKLLSLDKLDTRNDDDVDFLVSRENDDARPAVEGRKSRKELLAEIKTKTVEYGQLLIQAQTLSAMNKPSDRDWSSVLNYVECESELMEKDASFIYHKEDLVTLRPGREHAWLDSTVEDILIWLRCKPIEYLFVSPLTRRKTKNGNVRYYTRTRINTLVTAIITFCILVLLVVPIYALYRLTVENGRHAADTACIGVLLVSTLIFSAAISCFTKAKRHECLAAAAG